MININRAYISKVVLHRVGHKVREEKNEISDELMPLTDTLDEVLKSYFLNSFKKVSTLYQFQKSAVSNNDVVYNSCYEVFKEEVLGKNKELLETFNDYKEDYSEANEVQFWDSFKVDQRVFKSHRKAFQLEIKLDTKIKIVLDSNSLEDVTENFEKGYDENKKMNFYKVYFNQEI